MERLVGRQRELAQARAALDAALAGAGGLLLLAGEAGIGKSRLVAAVVAQTGVRTLRTTCWDDPGTPAYWPWTTALRECAAATGRELGDELTPILGRGPATDGPAQQLRLRLFDSVASYLAAVADRAPLVIVLEDLHFADQASLDLLRFLAASLRGRPVAIVGSHRYPDLVPGSPFLQTLGDLARTGRTITLPGLAEAEVGELISAATGRPPSAQLTRRVHGRTGGNPLFVIEIARLLATQQPHARDPDPQLPLPPSVKRVIGQRLSYLGRDTLDVLAQASVVGQVFSTPILAAATGRPERQIVDLLDDAARAGLVRPLDPLGQFTFAHALVRDVLYAGKPAASRRRVHLLVAQAIEARYAHHLDSRLDQLADHHVRAMPDADPAVALEYSRRAGDHALGTLAYEQAARHFGHAVELAVPAQADEADRVKLLLALGDARLRAGDQAGAATAYEAVAASARRRHRPDELARAALGFGSGHSGFEVRLFDQHQLDLLREALAGLSDDQPGLRAWVLARLSVAESFLVADEVRGRHSREALDLARQVGDPKLLAYALSSYCDARPGPAHTPQRLALADEMVKLGLDARDPESELLGRRFRLVAKLESGDLPGVDAEIEAFALTASRLRWPLVEWYPLMWRGMRALIEGRLDDAEALAVAAKEIGRRGGSVNAEATADYSLLPYVLLERGRVDEVYALVERFIEDPEAGPDAEAWAALPLARMGRHSQARSLLDRLAAARFPLQADGSWLDKVAALAEACAEVGHTEAAQRLLPVVEPFAGRFHTGGTGTCCGGSMSRYLGLLAACLGRWDDADEYFRRALAANRSAGATLLVAHTQRQHARMLAARDRAGDREQATTMLAEADETYRQLGLDHWISHPAREATDGLRAPGPNVFHQDGDTWTLRYGDREARVRHVKGFHALARLLANPGREFHVFDLLGDGTRADRAGLSQGTGDVIDAQARQAYKRRLDELDAQLDESRLTGDTAGAERAKSERDTLVDQLAAAYGLGGRVRQGHDPAERARSTVTKRIHSAIARIQQPHPSLSMHLANSIRTGRYCSYTPEQATTWVM